MAEYIERELIYGDFEKCNDNNSKWTPGRVKILIARQPAADVAPVVHGRWIKVFDDSAGWVDICNKCKEFGDGTPYCPNCGAKMDIEE